MDLTVFDYIIFFIILFFTILGLIRGFVGELTSLISWLGAIFITVKLNPLLSDIIYQKIQNSIFANLSSSGIIFVISIILLSILLSRISEKIVAKMPTSINLTLGTLIGIVKGILVSTIIFLIILELMIEKKDYTDLSQKIGPQWLQNSKSYTMLSFGAYAISPFTNSFLEKKANKKVNEIDTKEAIKEENKKIKNEEKEEDKINNLRRFNDEEEISDEDRNELDNIIQEQVIPDEDGYNEDQRKELDYLIDAI